MKKHTGLWIAAIIVFCLGISLIAAGAASGATQLIKNSDGLFERVCNFIESNISNLKDPVEIIEISNSTEDIKKLNIKLEGYAVSLKPTSKNEISVKHKNVTADDPNITITSENGTMTVEGTNTDMTLTNLTVEVLIPKKLSPEVIIETANSAISVEELSLASLTCNTADAVISVEDVKCTASVALTSASALISVDEIYADGISINSNTGVIAFDSLHFNSLDIVNQTGAVNGELESRSLYTVTTTRNGNTETVGTGAKTVNITTDTGIVNIEYDS